MHKAWMIWLLGWVMTSSVVSAVEPPEWAVLECRGLQDLAQVAHYWVDRQSPEGSFGFGGLDRDCEFFNSWIVFIYTADDQRILEALRKGLDYVWYHDHVQDGYGASPTDAQHGGEVMSYTQPLLAVADYGNPILIERWMITAQNMNRWTAINRAGHRHFRGHWLGSQETRDYSYFGADATIIGRVTLPMMHLLWYNRDPDLARLCTEWGQAWVDHAKETRWGKPYGLLPGEVVFESDEAGGFTKNWYDSASSGFPLYKSPWFMTRLLQMLMMNYQITGNPDFLLPIRETLRFYATARPDNLPQGVTMWPAWYKDRIPPRDGKKPEDMPYVWEHYKNQLGDRALKMYRGFTGDCSFDAWYGHKTQPPSRQMALETGKWASREATKLLQIARTINVQGNLEHYRAKISEGDFPALYHGGNNWVDWPRPACRWINGRYELGVVLLNHSPTRFKALCCNIGKDKRNFGLQLFELEPGIYRLSLGIDTNGDDRADKQVREEDISMERGTELALELEQGHEYLVELQQMAKGPAWQSRADVAVCGQDLFAIPAAPVAGSQATLKVRVHNIGSEDARQVTVWAEELPSGRFIGMDTINILARPRNMIPSSVMVEMPWSISAEATGVRVIADKMNVVEELYEGNNVAEIKLAELPEGPRIKRKIYLPAWYERQKEGPVADYTAPYVQGIKIDGKIDEPAWQKAERRGPLTDMEGQPTEKQTYVRMAYGEDALYVAFECPEPNMDLIHDLATLHDDYAIFGDESAEIFIDTNLDKRTYLQFAFNTANVQAEGQYYNFTIYNEPWESAVFKGKDYWSAEAKIPFASLKAVAKAGQIWGINLYRTVRTFKIPESEAERRKGWKGTERHVFSVTDDFHAPDRFGEVTFGPKN